MSTLFYVTSIDFISVTQIGDTVWKFVGIERNKDVAYSFADTFYVLVHSATVSLKIRSYLEHRCWKRKSIEVEGV